MHKTVVLPLPSGAAQTTVRATANLGSSVEQQQVHNYFTDGFLHREALHGRSEMVRKFVTKYATTKERGHKINLNGFDEQGCAVLHYAACSGLVDTCQVLLDNNADVNIGKQNTGFTPLHFACEGGHTAICLLLLETGAEINCQAVTTSENRIQRGDLSTPLMAAVKGQHLGLVSFLLSGVSRKQKRSQPEIVRASVSAVDASGCTALHYAASIGRRDLVSCLLDADSDINAVNLAGEAPLHVAVWDLHLDVVRELLDHGADPSAATANGQTSMRQCAAMIASARRRGVRPKAGEGPTLIDPSKESSEIDAAGDSGSQEAAGSAAVTAKAPADAAAPARGGSAKITADSAKVELVTSVMAELVERGAFLPAGDRYFADGVPADMVAACAVNERRAAASPQRERQADDVRLRL